ncbi:MAG: glycosyltransferase family 39 protein [Nostoc sp. DedQUE12b]|uniref:glycosyltransferase family 39 protein n=1 Tax=Nostoc sp. DedQUE12b TaxID=3075398 RepID=UPI002AD4620F|nr:glycosyltransferase family 39 protein [Nostoc sp. DedQUE12b]MDZ8085306.1 glycosyltransferase family 39 protein [Nostoc sp. DedQUE12b]
MRHLQLAPNRLQFLIVVLLMVGIFFRFFNLDRKVYWHDETFTSLRISGYTANEVKQQIFNGRIINKESFAKFQSPNMEKGLRDTIRSLEVEDPQHPPLYYIIARFWVEIFGNSVTVIRSLSAFISLLIFPSIYWLCRELFKASAWVSEVAIALMAISPIHLIYAQEAREYILWIVTVLLCSASLLRALRLESKDRVLRILNWGMYAVTLMLSLYTFLFSGFVMIAHGIYVIATAKFKFTRTVKAYLLASLAGLLAFTPWIIVIIVNLLQLKSSTAWTKRHLPLDVLIKSWLLQLNRIFLDLNSGFENPFNYIITPFFLVLFGYSIYFICRKSNYKIWLFIVTLIMIPALPLMLPDLLFGGIRSLAERYLLISYLGIQLAVTYLLATQLHNKSFVRRRIWQIIMGLVIICGLVSYGVSSQAETWWSKVISSGNPQVAKIINQATHPLLISNDSGINYGNVFSLSYLLEPKVQFQLVKDRSIPNIPNGFTDIFLLNPSDSWRKQIETNYNYKTFVVYGDNNYLLWKIENPRSNVFFEKIIT